MADDMVEKREKFQLYNTMTKKKEAFKPIVEGKVGMYVCGVTPYDLSHIGHARAYVAFDILYRYLLQHLGYEVKYVRNFTDVDDKIIRRANENHEDPKDLSARFSQEFLNDMKDLNCLSPTHEPRVTDHIQEIKDMISQIISNDCAYAVDGDVYLSVEKIPNYCALSRRKTEDNKAGAGGRVDAVETEKKRNPSDFALWKAAKPGEPQWDSPWGPGRPGWHIECSAMSAKYLGDSFDIHGGGLDLIFPHHENEIAQSCAAAGCSKSQVNYWLHNGFVNLKNEKMSKSEKNFFTIRQVTDLFHPLALRYFLLGTHYRSDVNYSKTLIEISSKEVYYVYQTLKDCEDALLSLEKEGESTQAEDPIVGTLRNEVETQLSDDLHTPTILTGALKEALTHMNSTINTLKKKPQKKMKVSIKKTLTDLQREIRKVLDVLGLLSESSYSEVIRQINEKGLKGAGLTEEYVLDCIAKRKEARVNKDYAKGDEIRKDLAEKGIELQDVGKDTIWRHKAYENTV